MEGEGAQITRRTVLAGLAALPFGRWMVDDRLVDFNVRAAAGAWSRLPLGERVVRAGNFFLGTPYVGGTLDAHPESERCTLVFEGLDCVTFVELSFALALALGRGNRATLESVKREIVRIRYRGGRIDGYASRLHYTTDGLADNASRGVLTLPLEADAARTTWSKPIDFMSKHPEAYPALSGYPERVSAIERVEKQIAARPLSWVERARVASLEPRLMSGDMVAFATDVPGLDCSHVGLVVREGDRARLLHASSAKAKVVLDRPLAEYVASSRRTTGVFVARLVQPPT